MCKYTCIYADTHTQKHRNTAPPDSFNILAPCDDSHLILVLQSYLQVYCDLGWGDRAAADLSLAVKAGTNASLRLGFVWCFGFIGFRIWFSCAVCVVFSVVFSWHFFFLILFLLQFHIHGRPPELNITKHRWGVAGLLLAGQHWSSAGTSAAAHHAVI